MMTTTALVVTSIVATVIGAGVAAYGQYQTGKTNQALSDFNARQQEKTTRDNLMAMQTQAAYQKQQADANFKLRATEAQARMNNARSIENQALSQDAINRRNLQKRREDFGRMQATQRAAIAASGVAEASGTPLDLLAETAAKIQLDQEEQHYGGELQRRTLFSEAARERLGGKLALAGATLDRDSTVAEAALRDASSKAAYQAGMREAEITRLTGAAAATAANYQAAGTLLSGIGSAAGTAASIKPKQSAGTPVYKKS